MADDNSKNKKRKEKESVVLDKVAQSVASIYEAKHVDTVICALHSLAVLLFPVDSLCVSDTVGKQYRDQVINANVHSVEERREWWGVFYKGVAFPTLARVLLNDVASNWLACFPLSASKNVYDVFFVNGDIVEVVQTVVPFIRKTSDGSSDVCSNAGRVLTLCLLDNNGLLQMAREFGASPKLEEIDKLVISRLVQLVTSIPDKAHSVALNALSSHIYYKQTVSQLLSGAEEFDSNMCNKALILDDNGSDGSLLFIGEVLARICRRGSADIVLSEMVSRILAHVRSALSSDSNLTTSEVFELKPGFLFWRNIIKAIRDPFAVEKMSEHLLRHLEAAHISDVEAYWTLWILFKEVLTHKASIRTMFVDKFLLWKVFPICCLRWIIQFAILEFPPGATKSHNSSGLLDIVQHLAAAWCRRELVQSASMEQQAYITAALGLTLEKISKEDLAATKDVMQSILEGVSCRLESPTHLVRKMASSIALVFSIVIDPNNPLYLDDSCQEETIDWEFGLANRREKGTCSTTKLLDDNVSESEATDLLLRKNLLKEADSEKRNISKARKTRLSEFKLVDPDEVIDPAVLNSELGSDEEEDDDDASVESETSSQSSLQPYDLSDDDVDLKQKISQLVDVVGALRKSDDPDGVDRALDVAEKLIRASPDELRYIASDLVRILVQVRCCDSAVDGEEESAEEKRQKALVALISTSPFESLDTVGNLLYSPNLDISQRIMILDVMTYAAQELSDAKITKPKNNANKILISDASDAQPWFVPNNVGPMGAGPWKEISRNGTPLNWSYSYERDLPVRSIQVSRGKTRRWSLRSKSRPSNEMEQSSENKFPQYAAAFMLPAMRGFDKKRQGVDLLGRDFIVLGKLIYMLGVCMKCAAMHPEASALAPALIDMLSSREVCHHAEAYVRRSVVFAASCILVAIHPSFVASSLIEGNTEISKGLEWIREWALHVADSDPDRECYTLSIACLQLHSEMALQTSRALETIRTKSSSTSISSLSPNPFKGEIKIPRGSLEF
ncbi:telomere length regulation protein TEL2 homolog [Impatiens glandulifera]|uniref:telomere length regulation protein TEL2 homolog n=1 Tax=Impatiens glandulifera TaxID=253017 RepID=UPI001FB0D57C|nr:telomere length regulation protein TEL2 homolog [Impatiens glandulifera]